MPAAVHRDVAPPVSHVQTTGTSIITSYKQKGQKKQKGTKSNSPSLCGSFAPCKDEGCIDASCVEEAIEAEMRIIAIILQKQANEDLVKNAESDAEFKNLDTENLVNDGPPPIVYYPPGWRRGDHPPPFEADSDDDDGPPPQARVLQPLKRLRPTTTATTTTRRLPTTTARGILAAVRHWRWGCVESSKSASRPC